MRFLSLVITATTGFISASGVQSATQVLPPCGAEAASYGMIAMPSDFARPAKELTKCLDDAGFGVPGRLAGTTLGTSSAIDAVNCQLSGTCDTGVAGDVPDQLWREFETFLVQRGIQLDTNEELIIVPKTRIDAFVEGGATGVGAGGQNSPKPSDHIRKLSTVLVLPDVWAVLSVALWITSVAAGLMALVALLGKYGTPGWQNSEPGRHQGAPAPLPEAFFYESGRGDAANSQRLTPPHAGHVRP